MSNVEQGPQPGEIWLVTENEYPNETRGYGPHRILWDHTERPLLILAVTTGFIWYAQDDGNGETKREQLPRGAFPWHEHLVRIWPVVPSWEEVQRAPEEIRERP